MGVTGTLVCLQGFQVRKERLLEGFGRASGAGGVLSQSERLQPAALAERVLQSEQPELRRPAPGGGEGYVGRGLAVVPIPEGRKRPIVPAWQALRIRPAQLDDYFNGSPQNVGILLGELSGWVVDVDLDTPEAVELGSRFLSPTLMSGRQSVPRSHWWYRSEGARTERWKDTDGVTLVELRSTGCQTVVEPSTHPEGDRYLWHHEPDQVGGYSRITELDREELAHACRS